MGSGMSFLGLGEILNGMGIDGESMGYVWGVAGMYRRYISQQATKIIEYMIYDRQYMNEINKMLMSS
jgi:hypothetical protein